MNEKPFVRTSGHGPAVLCLHSTGASSRQWDALAARLAPRYRVLAADLRGHGKSLAWGRGVVPTLHREAALLAPLLDAEEGGVHLVGHSYGGAVALKLATMRPDRVRSLTLFEPVMFRVLLDVEPPEAAGREAIAVGAEIREALESGRAQESARIFFEYWSGPGTWEQVSPGARSGLTARMDIVVACFDALFRDRTSLGDLARLDMPALLMNGSASPASARAATERIAYALARARRHEFAGLGHMGPLVRSEVVNGVIEEFLEAHGARRPAFVSPTGAAPAWLRQAFAA